MAGSGYPPPRICILFSGRHNISRCPPDAVFLEFAKARAADPQDRAPAPGAGGGKSWAPFSGLCQVWGGNVHKAPARPGTLTVSPGANEGGQERTRVPSEDAGLAPESFPRGSDSLYFVTGSEPTRVITCCLTSSGVRKWGKKGQAG